MHNKGSGRTMRTDGILQDKEERWGKTEPARQKRQHRSKRELTRSYCTGPKGHTRL
jgi:hypothetical protein